MKKSENSILVAFLLNLFFSLFEFVGGSLTNSVAIMSDAIHDMGDAIAIGLSYALERKSRKNADHRNTYGYARYSVLGSVLTTSILIASSAIIINESILRFLEPERVNEFAMLILAVFGLVVNSIALFITSGKKSLNQKAVNLHMLEDVLGWIAVLIGAIIMNITHFTLIDPIMSLVVAVFILYNAIRNFHEVLEVLLEKVPADISVSDIKKAALQLPGVINIHHVHVWSIDGMSNIATMHIIVDGNAAEVKHNLKNLLREFDIDHATIETELIDELCGEGEICESATKATNVHAHSHGHNHHHEHEHEHIDNNVDEEDLRKGKHHDHHKASEKANVKAKSLTSKKKSK